MTETMVIMMVLVIIMGMRTDKHDSVGVQDLYLRSALLLASSPLKAVLRYMCARALFGQACDLTYLTCNL